MWLVSVSPCCELDELLLDLAGRTGSAGGGAALVANEGWISAYSLNHHVGCRDQLLRLLRPWVQRLVRRRVASTSDAIPGIRSRVAPFRVGPNEPCLRC